MLHPRGFRDLTSALENQHVQPMSTSSPAPLTPIGYTAYIPVPSPLVLAWPDQADFCTADGLALQAIPLLPCHLPQVAWLMRNDTDREQLCASHRHVRCEDAASAWCQGAQTRFNTILAGCADGAPVGLLRIEAGRLAYLIDPTFRRRRIATAGIQWLLGQLQPGAAPLLAQVERNNIASRRTLEGVGFRFAGLADAGRHGLPLLNFTYRDASPV